ncbi:MAG TPA: ABC transporter permease [Candidatus Hydrogenedentes bacterium]|nr:ABC transporter permease [Candidatus Hydrogenedentota bacterium]
MAVEPRRYDAATRRLLVFGPLLAALLLETIIFEVVGRYQGKPSFFSLDNAILILNQSSVHGVVAVGMTFVILTGGIDLSVGSMLAFAGVICALVTQWGGDPVALWIGGGWIAALALGATAGALVGLLVTRFAIPPFIATLALMSSLRGLGNLITDGKPVSPLPELYAQVGRYQLFGHVPVSVLFFIAALVCGATLLNMTRFGRYVRAIGGNEESARLSGVNVARVKLLVYAFCGGLTALAGLILSSRLGAGSPKVGVGDELAVIAAVVVGGTSLSGGRGSVGGTFVGLLVVSVLNSGLSWTGVETFGQQVTLGLVILAAVLLDKLKGDV